MAQPLYGVWPWPAVGPEIDAPSVQLGALVLDLKPGSEQIVDQVGGMVASLEVVEPGNYTLHLDAAVQFDEPERVYVFAQPYDLEPRLAVVSVDAKAFSLNVFDIDGLRSACDRCALSISFDPWTPTKETNDHDDALSRVATGGPAAARMGSHQRSHGRRGETGWRYLRHVFSRRAGPDPDGSKHADRRK